VSVINTGTPTTNDVAGLKVLLYRSTDSPGTPTVTCGTGNVTAAASNEVPLTCSATYDLDADDQAAKTVSLLAKVSGEYAGPTPVDGTSTPATVVDLKGSLTVQPVSLEVGANPVTTLAPAAANDAVNITFTFRNTGPVDVTGITVTGPSPGTAVVAACDAIPATAPALAAATADTTCTATYTVLPADLASPTKRLTFGLAVSDTNLATLPWATPNIVVDIPVTPILTTDFTAADCAPVSTGEPQ
jgi:hypothetical protein